MVDKKLRKAVRDVVSESMRLPNGTIARDVHGVRERVVPLLCTLIDELLQAERAYAEKLKTIVKDVPSAFVTVRSVRGSYRYCKHCYPGYYTGTGMVGCTESEDPKIIPLGHGRNCVYDRAQKALAEGRPGV